MRLSALSYVFYSLSFMIVFFNDGGVYPVALAVVDPAVGHECFHVQRCSGLKSDRYNTVTMSAKTT